MRVLLLIIRELWHRKLHAVLSLAALTATVALYVGFHTLGAAMDRETTMLMRDLGFNLRIIPKGVDEVEFWQRGYALETMPQEYVERFATSPGLSYRHLVATLQQWVPAADMQVLLTGIAPEVQPPQAGSDKTPMIFEVAPGQVYLGHQVAQRMGKGVGDSVALLGETFTVAQTLAESGSEKDARVYANIGDAQRLLKLEGRINEIQALECLCRNPDVESIDILRAELAKLMPEAAVLQLSEKAKARERQRLTGEAYFALLMQAVLAACALWVGVLAWLNVRERRYEIGVLRALGYGSVTIGFLVLGKAALLGAIAAGLGFKAGSWLAGVYGPAVFEVTAKSIAPEYALLQQALWAAPLFAAACSLIPASAAVAQDPAIILRNE